jgi:pilus assembly protein CpaC
MLNNQELKKFTRASRIIFSLAILLVFTFLTGATAYDVDPSSEQEVEMLVGEIKTVKAYSATRVAVTDPSIADVDKVEGDEILLSAKKAGNTGLTIWDKYGERSVQIRVYAETLDSLRDRLKQLLVSLRISDLVFKPSKEEGKMILTGAVLSDDKKQLDTLLSPFSDRIINLIKVVDETAIVQFDVQILELSKSASKSLGVDWIQAMQLREEPYSSSSSSTSGVTTTLNKIGSIPQIFRVVDFSRDAITAKINMLVSEGKAKILSRPKLVCLSGKEAEFLVGGQVPIVTTTTSSGGNVSSNVEYKDYGVNLKVKPVVKGEQIDTTINTDISDIDSANAVTVNGAKILAFLTRSASTQVYLKDGQTIFIAGLIRNNKSTNISGIPFIKDVPFLGAIFRSKSTTETETELVIALTPTIVKGAKKPTSIGSATLEEVPPLDQAFPSGAEESEVEAEAQELTLINQVSLPDSVSSYVRGVQERIAQAVTFPDEAKKYKWQGMVRLGLRILYDGSLTEASIRESSGYEILDDDALAAAKKQAPFSAFPSDITAQELVLDVPVVYKLESQK